MGDHLGIPGAVGVKINKLKKNKTTAFDPVHDRFFWEEELIIN